MVEGIQYGGGISPIRWKIFSTDVSHHQYGRCASSVQWRAWYGPVTSSIQRRVCMATKTAQGVVGGCIFLGK